MHDCGCDLCGIKDFTGYRYKCLVCQEYNLCSRCFKCRNTNKNHQLNHPMAKFDYPDELFGQKFENSVITLINFRNIFKNQDHKSVRCDLCSISPIRGVRLKCDICHEFDVCLECYYKQLSTIAHNFNTHPLIIQEADLNSLVLDPNSIELGERLGKGAFGSVYKAKLKNLDNKVVACKVISIGSNLNSDDLSLLYKSYVRELEGYNELKGVNILKMIGHCQQIFANTTNYMIVTEFMSKGSLANLLKNETNLSLRRKFFIACDIASGMNRMHNNNFIHRDIRPDNILIDADYTAKIADMGIAKGNPIETHLFLNANCNYLL